MNVVVNDLPEVRTETEATDTPMVWIEYKPEEGEMNHRHGRRCSRLDAGRRGAALAARLKRLLLRRSYKRQHFVRAHGWFLSRRGRVFARDSWRSWRYLR